MNPEQMRDASLLELFQMETSSQVQILNDGLLALESDPASMRDIEACMRAVHSLKGAARIVDLEPTVRIAHAMEDYLMAAQQMRLVLSAANIDVLLQGADMLQRAAQTNAPLDTEIDDWIARLEGRAAPSASGVPEPVINAMPVMPQRRAADQSPAEAPGLQGERVLRVNADTLNRLLGLSSQSLVKSHWIAPFGGSLQHLRRTQAQAIKALELARAALDEEGASEGLRLALEDVHARLRHVQGELSQRAQEVEQFSWRLGDLSQRLYDTALACRMRPFGDCVHGLPRVARDLARALGKQVRLEIQGEDTPVDRDIIDKLDSPLMQLLRNALDHGIEMPAARVAAGKSPEGLIVLSARHAAGRLVIEVTDDGAGMNVELLRRQVIERGLTDAETAARLSQAELLEFLFLSGFSTRAEVSEISGRGVGLDVVQSVLRELHGSVRVQQESGQGSRFSLELPLSLSVLRSLLVEIDGDIYAFPLAAVQRALRVPLAEIGQLEGRQYFRFQGQSVGLVPARQILRLGAEPAAADEVCVVLIGDQESRYGVAVDRYLSERTLVVQPLDPRLGKVRDIMAGALLDDGTPLLILDVEDVLASVRQWVEGGETAQMQGAQARSRRRVLVVDDSLTVRELERKLLLNRGYDVAVAVDGMEGWNMLRGDAFDLVITDVDMPRMDGIELVTRLKADPRLRGTPVMVVSYKDREEDRQRGLDAGADYYLAKSSFHDDALMQAVEDLIGEPEK
ncbi:hybrid sensor histidine kinase/response regulator [Bordetella avium]|uniref:hybrid sensor histidine kinase/response regulator n=1 Tax=Bordetella avium TaxID=521 RepID=UPI000E6A6934|nr:hybrid sensor histidine kinase/response regulator [Bordetella avium]RIQ39529.1 hybrid sensor histidine kinase/response regulator [Bordetella avium]RIQ44328.1 hybrid sensor histidine kinase/response regulator [Bordetella avium]RIQ45454.1 hybrid sensor histidine kinase/response regulator [Bordetella avium]RIQ51367.1 hybrid sensor histidine kinase/response regulator [Bordetella avium]RIQ62677.1 hybrid sensor histidine kinase/response regulator [Bordetella avium]